jgi:prenyltransferase beta subunit
MSLRVEMLDAARLAPKLLGDSTELVREFLLRQQAPDGGFKDRAGNSDLYYTAFGLDALLEVGEAKGEGRGEKCEPGGERSEGCVGEAFERAGKYLRSFGDGAGVDFVHLCCLARGWAAVSERSSGRMPATDAQSVLNGIERHRSGDGGYNPVAASQCGSAYGAFLALGAYQDLAAALPDPARLIESLQSLARPDGGFANESYGVPALAGSPADAMAPGRPKPELQPNATASRFTFHVSPAATNATAAAVAVLSNLGVPVSASIAQWLLDRAHPQGGFLATPDAPMPDLLSTATALHALAQLQAPLGPRLEACLDFVDSLWTNEGGFYGHWGDNQLDCEYAFYGLLALGHLCVKDKLWRQDGL